jgi:hypothetical protein
MGRTVRTWLLAVLAVLFALPTAAAAVACSPPPPSTAAPAVKSVVVTGKPAPPTPLRRAVDSVGKVDSAIRAGVSSDDYASMLSSAAAAVDSYRPADAAGTSVKRSLAKALLYYRAAREAWELDLASAWWDGQDKAAYWKPTYPELDLGGAVSGVTAQQVRAAAWAVAGGAYAQAKKSAAGAK